MSFPILRYSSDASFSKLSYSNGILNGSRNMIRHVVCCARLCICYINGFVGVIESLPICRLPPVTFLRAVFNPDLWDVALCHSKFVSTGPFSLSSTVMSPIGHGTCPCQCARAPSIDTRAHTYSPHVYHYVHIGFPQWIYICRHMFAFSYTATDDSEDDLSSEASVLGSRSSVMQHHHPTDSRTVSLFMF